MLRYCELFSGDIQYTIEYKFIDKSQSNIITEISRKNKNNVKKLTGKIRKGTKKDLNQIKAIFPDGWNEDDFSAIKHYVKKGTVYVFVLDNVSTKENVIAGLVVINSRKKNNFVKK